MNRKNPQQGMILVLVMILILPLTLIALSIMQSGREQLKMSSATSHRLILQTNIESEVVKFWSKNMIRSELISMLKAEKSKTNKLEKAAVTARNYISSCSRNITASSSNLIRKCHYMTITLPASKDDSPSANIVVELPLVWLQSMVEKS